MFDNSRLSGKNARYILASEGFWLSDKCRIRAFFPFHAVDVLDHQEHGKGYDDKADDGVDEGPQVEGNGPGGLGRGEA